MTAMRCAGSVHSLVVIVVVVVVVVVVVMALLDVPPHLGLYRRPFLSAFLHLGDLLVGPVVAAAGFHGREALAELEHLGVASRQGMQAKRE